MNLLGSHVGTREDLAEVRVGNRSKVVTIFNVDTQYDGIGGQGFAFTAGNVFGQLAHNAAQYQHRLAVVGQTTAGVTAVGAGGHAEGGVTGGAVGDGGDQVGRQAALTFKQHVAPTATGAARCNSKDIHGGSSEHSTNQDPFHDGISILWGGAWNLASSPLSLQLHDLIAAL